MYAESSRSFESNRVLGGVGAILAAIGSFIPFSASIGIVYIIGIILVLISMNGLSQDFKEPAISRNALMGFLFGVIGVIIGVVAFAIARASILSGLTLYRILFRALLYVGALLVVLIFLVLAAVFFKRAFEILETKSGERILNTGGLLLLIGAILTIVLIGFVLLFVAWVLIAIGLFSMRQTTQTNAAQIVSPAPPPLSSAPPGTVKYCPYCGAENKLESTFCTHCGRRMT